MIKLNGKVVEVKKFPNGESFINIKDLEILEAINEIKFKFESDDDITHLMFLKNHLDEKRAKAKLIIGYMPYSRMDRTEGMRVFTLKYIAKLINILNFEEVIVYEPHSDVTMALLDRARQVDMSAEIGLELVNKLKGVYIVYPDAGAAKRYSKQIKYDKILTANKERDFETGNIKSLEINGQIKEKEFNAVIIDDLCSKGGTFILTANKLKELGAKDIYLVVTHTENTIFEGSILNTDLIKEVYTTNSILSRQDKKIIIKEII